MAKFLTTLLLCPVWALAAETWTRVPLVDTNAKALAALHTTKKSDHLLATVTGQRDGDSIHVESIAFD